MVRSDYEECSVDSCRHKTAAGRGLIYFMDLHILIYSQIRVANGRAGRRRSVARNGIEFRSGAFHGVTVAVTFGPGHRQHVRGDEVWQRCATPVGGNVGPLCLGDLQQVAAHTGEADSLRRCGATVRGRQFL